MKVYQVARLGTPPNDKPAAYYAFSDGYLVDRREAIELAGRLNRDPERYARWTVLALEVEEVTE